MTKNVAWRWLKGLMAAALLAAASGCGEDGPAQGSSDAGHALIMYFPWSGNLTSYFQQNIADMATAIEAAGLDDQRVVVYFASSATDAELFEFEIGSDGAPVRVTLKTYANQSTSTAEGVAEIFSDIRSLVPASRYSLTIGSHGMGWLPVAASETAASASLRKSAGAEAGLPTRYFGGTTAAYQIDVADFAEGIEQAGLHFGYILFDDCYMSSIEAAYDLRGVADYIVASPTEMMARGLPYATVGGYLLGDADLEAVCDGFYNYYALSNTPFAALAVTDCGELEAMAAVMKTINGACSSLTEDEAAAVQNLDCYSPAVFFDLGDYVSALCGADAALLSAFEAQLAKTVVYEVHTDYYYTSAAGRELLSACCGVSVSDPSYNSLASRKTQTAWWAATH